MSPGGEDVTRRRVDLGRLPRWLQYLIALAVVAVVVTAAWRSGGRTPPPAWAEGPMVTALGVLFLVLLTIGLGSRLLRRRIRKSASRPSRGETDR
jgi:peptidoglycan/LPS O-acetylase OafA/YrhL